MREIRQFPTTAFTVSADYDQEYSGSFVEQVGFKLDGTSTDAGTGTLTQDAGARLLGSQVRVEQNEETLIAVNPITLKHLSAVTNGGYEKTEESGSTGAQKLLANMHLDLTKIIPGAGIDARQDKVFQRGTFGALADYTDGVDSIAATNRPWVRTNAEAAPVGFWRPQFAERSVDISTATTDQQVVFRFERAQAVPGFFLRQFDSSADARVDGLLRRLLVTITRAGRGDRQVMSTTWGILRQTTANAAGFTSGDWDNALGTAMVQIRDPRKPELGGATLFEQGDSITFTLDTSTTVEGEFTSVTPAAGDKLFLTKIAFDRVENGVVVKTFRGTSSNRRPQRGARAGRR